jgi:hypothetical protein
MSATALPLPLALSKPVALTSDLNTLLGAGSATYDPATQMGVTAGGIGGSKTNTKCFNAGVIQVDDVAVEL